MKENQKIETQWNILYNVNIDKYKGGKSLGYIHHSRKRKKGKHLRFEDRQFIEYLVRKAYPKKVSISLLVESIGCSESTIRRELKEEK